MKAIIEFVSGGVGVLASIVSGAARLAGNAALASSAASVAAKAGHALGTVVAGIEIVYGVAVLLDPHATGMQKIEGAAHAASGAAYFLGQVAGFSGAAASLSILVSYKLFKEMLLLGGRAAVGLNTAFLKEAQGTMVNAAQGIVRLGDRLVKAGELAHQETDAIKSKALLEEEQDAARGLSGTIDNFLDDCNPKGAGHGWGNPNVARFPGNYPILAEMFAPFQSQRGTRTGAQAAAMGTAILEKIMWCFANWHHIVLESTKKDRHLKDVEKASEKEEQERKQAEHGGGH